MHKERIFIKQLTDTFDFLGKWWHPGKPEAFMMGRLTFVPEKSAQLELIADFKSITNSNDSLEVFEELIGIRELDKKIIHGSTISGEIITLFECTAKGAAFIVGGSPVYTFHFKYIFVGKHFDTIEDIGSQTLQIEFTYLENLLGDISKKELAPVSIEDYTLSISLNSTDPLTYKIQVEQNNLEKFTLAKSREIVYDAQKFLCMMTMEPIYPLAIDGISQGRSSKTRVRMFYKKIGTREPTLLGVSDKNYMLFKSEEILEGFMRFSKNMISDLELKRLNNLFFGFFYSPPPLGENRFLNLTQSIEGFHRAVYKGEYLGKKSIIN